MAKFLISWLVNAIALYIVVHLINGITVADTKSLLIAALVIGILNALIKPVLQLISLPITLLTFGLFSLIVNAALFGLAAWLVPGLHINGFWAAFFGAILISIISSLLMHLTNPKKVY